MTRDIGKGGNAAAAEEVKQANFMSIRRDQHALWAFLAQDVGYGEYFTVLAITDNLVVTRRVAEIAVVEGVAQNSWRVRCHNKDCEDRNRS